MNTLKPVSNFVAAEVTRRRDWSFRENPPPHVGGYVQNRFSRLLLRSSCRLVALCAVSFCLIGCSLVKPPKGVTPRSFVLTPISVPTPTARTESTNLAVGMRPVKMPGYLSTKALTMRQRNNEVVYLESLGWAERLDTALQRVLAEDLGAFIPTDQVRLSRWAPDAVAVEVDVNVVRFDVDSQGQGVLVAWWRLLSPGDEKVIASGRFSVSRKGPPPNTDPVGAAALMSSLAADLAEKLVSAINAPKSETR
jgi:cholesterol transport system auxiliary component